MFSKRHLALIFICFVASISESAFASNCVQGAVRVVEFGKEIEKPASYCFGDADDLITSNPFAESSVASQAMQSKLPVNIDDLIGPFGSPASKLCEKIGGEFEIVDFKKEKSWVIGDRCVFSDGSFVSGSKLVVENRAKLAK